MWQGVHPRRRHLREEGRGQGRLDQVPAVPVGHSDRRHAAGRPEGRGRKAARRRYGSGGGTCCGAVPTRESSSADADRPRESERRWRDPFSRPRSGRNDLGGGQRRDRRRSRALRRGDGARDLTGQAQARYPGLARRSGRVAGDQERPRSCQAPASAEAAAPITREIHARKASAARAGASARGGQVRPTSGIAGASARGGQVRPTSGIADASARGGQVRPASRVTDATARGRRICSATEVATSSSRRDQGRDATTRRAWCEGADTGADAVHGARGRRRIHPHRRPGDACGGATGDGRVRTSAEKAGDT
jgi:hypothetical protein